MKTDRRHIYRRIREIEKDLEKVKDRRCHLRERRQKNRIPVVRWWDILMQVKQLMNALKGGSSVLEVKSFLLLWILCPDPMNS